LAKIPDRLPAKATATGKLPNRTYYFAAAISDIMPKYGNKSVQPLPDAASAKDRLIALATQGKSLR
jgi:hypothetical protein